MQKKIFFILFAFVAMMATGEAVAQEILTGKASYYANKFHGRRTSSGAIYHRDSMTCAHKTLPFGTLLKVRNVKTGKEVVVKVTDRGPFCRGRIVDLSYAAAKELGIVGSGVANVQATKVGFVPGKKSVKKNQRIAEIKLISPLSGEYYKVSDWKLRDKVTIKSKVKAPLTRNYRPAASTQSKKQVARYYRQAKKTWM